MSVRGVVSCSRAISDWRLPYFFFCTCVSDYDDIHRYTSDDSISTVNVLDVRQTLLSHGQAKVLFKLVFLHLSAEMANRARG